MSREEKVGEVKNLVLRLRTPQVTEQVSVCRPIPLSVLQLQGTEGQVARKGEKMNDVGWSLIIVTRIFSYLRVRYGVPKLGV